MERENGKTKYVMLVEELRASMLRGDIKSGDKLPSENQLSTQYNISRHTVRKALAILENEGLIVAYHGKGTYCSNRVRQLKPSKNIAVITTYISDYIFPRLIQGIDRVLTEDGYSIILKNTRNSRMNEAKCLEDILSKDIDGLIIEPSKSQIICRHKHLYDLLDEYKIPYVFIQGIYPQMKHKPHIIMDDCKGGYLLTKYLIELGHKHIIGIFKADDTQGSERHRGYVKALQEAGRLYDPQMVIWFHTEDRMSKPVLSLDMIIGEGRPFDGVVCYNDEIALEIIKLLQKRGMSVPKEVSVTGYDNSFLAENLGVKLTTIAHPQEKLGEMAAEMLLNEIQEIRHGDGERITKACTSKIQLIEPELILRDSCKMRKQ
ncbi:MAG TPA: GntR family transcriptional regulator [Candidatus Merdenecus merdavium]|nr:GntR family transcriptional regulator [Candidatus Merdenecus merdavium]